VRVYLCVDMEGIGGVRFTAPNARTAYRGFLAGIRLAALVDAPAR
jgi:hypothetical protein